MAGILETIVGGMTGGADYLAGTAKAEQSWKDKDEYQQAKLDAQKQLFGDRLDQQRDMFNQRMANSGGGRGGKGPALPKTEEDLMQVAANNNIPLPRIKEYLDHIRSGQMPTRTLQTLSGGRDFRGPPTEGGVPADAENSYTESQVLDQAAAQRINEVGEYYGDAVLRTMNPDDYGSVMKGDEQRSLNGIIQAAINSKHPRAVESLAAWMRAHKGEGSFSGGENVITGKPSGFGIRKLEIDNQNADTNSKEAETKARKALFDESNPNNRRDFRKEELQDEIKLVQQELKIALIERGALLNQSPKDPHYASMTEGITAIKDRIIALQNSLAKPAPAPVPAPEPINYLKAQIPKVGG